MKKKLLALASLCLASFPLTSSAAVIWTDGSGGSWTFLASNTGVTGDTFTMDLPGDASVTGYQGTSLSLNYFGIGKTSGMTGAEFSRSVNPTDSFYYFNRLNAVQTWSDLPVDGDIADWGLVASMYNMNAGGGMGENYGTGNPIYIPFYFTDTTVSATRYGYIQLGVSGSGQADPLPTSSLTLAYTGWAYETDGTQIAMGAVPEPSTTVLFLAAGSWMMARGFRRKSEA